MVLRWEGICHSVNPDFFLEFHCLVMSFAASSCAALSAPAARAVARRKCLRFMTLSVLDYLTIFTPFGALQVVFTVPSGCFS